MSESIFKISTELEIIISELVDNGGEITPEIETALLIKEDELIGKSRNYGYVIKSLEYETSIIDQEIKRLQDHKKSRVNAVVRLKNVLTYAMEKFDIPEIKTPTMKINFRKSSAVEILDEDLIPKEFINTKITTTINKTEIKKAIKEGRKVKGAFVAENKNIQIK